MTESNLVGELWQNNRQLNEFKEAHKEIFEKLTNLTVTNVREIVQVQSLWCGKRS